MRWNNLNQLSFWTEKLFFFLPHHTACGILVPRPGIGPVPPEVEVEILNHWTAREVLDYETS